MESAAILTPQAPAQVVRCFLLEANNPEGPDYEKIPTLYDARGEWL